MNRGRSAIVAVTLSLGLALAGCGEGSTPSVDDADSGRSGGSRREGFTVNVSLDSIEVPEEVVGGVVEVTLRTELADSDANFTKVASGTTLEQFKQAISQTVSGGAIPDFLQATTGILAGERGRAKSTLVLPEGDYIAWTIPESPEEEEGDGGGGEGETTTTAAAAGETARAQQEGEGAQEESGGGGPPSEAILTDPFQVTAGEAGDLPDLDGNTITARDYTFDVNLTAGADEFVFRNEGPDQLHHVVLFNFGDIEPSVVEENLLAFLESGEGSPPPPAFEGLDLERLDAGGAPVLTPDLGTTSTLERKLAPGTYAAACFIADRAGGAPHAIANGMRTVFSIGK